MSNNEFDYGEDLYNKGGDNVPVPGITREVPKAAVRLGFHPPVGDPRLYSYSKVEALAKPRVAWDVTRDDRMPKVEAGIRMVRLMKLFGLAGENPVILDAFHDAVYYSLTVNSGSVLQPGRAKLMIAGTEFDYASVVTYLGEDLRRFSRAYADEIRANNMRILQWDDPTDFVRMEQAENVRQVAANRGLTRFPYLAHDSADACSGLTDAERAALVSSKAMVFASGVNMADRNRMRPGQGAASLAGSMFENPTAPVALGDH